MKLLIIWFSLILINFNLVNNQSSFHPQVNLYQGTVRGRQMRTDNEKEFYGFLGIPYALPPTGPLRFKQPLPHQGWSGVADAWTYKDGCPQLGYRSSDYGNEDCLYLNVYTLNIERKPFAPLYPVMVFIQSDSLEKSDSSLFGPEKLLDRGVVLVTFNYRIGVLGFLSTGDDAASGNWGLYDQQLVLKWIKDNIEAFSGDPNSVTLFGQGSGAAYTFFHMVSPLSQGLFHKAILQSGSGLCHWAIETDPLQYAEKIADNIRCSTSSTNSIVDCLRRASVYDLLRAESKEKIFSHYPRRAVPVVERHVKNALLPEDPRTLLARGFTNKIPIMAGVNRDETAYFYPLIVSAHYRGDSAYYEKYLIPQFLESATPFKGELKDRVIPEILFEYFNGIVPSNVTNVGKRFINMTTDALYVSCIDETIRLLAESGYSTYMYTFEYQGQNSMIELVLNGAPKMFPTGVSHGDELFYLFNLKIGRLKPPSFRDDRISQRMLTLWTDFAKYGRSPRIENHEHPRWASFSPDSSIYYEISDTLEPKRYYRVSEAHFWTVHLRNISGIEPNVLAQIKELRPMYKTLAWAMVGVSIGLLGLIALLLAVLYYQRRTSTFRSHPTENGSSHLSAVSSDIWNGLSPWIKKSQTGFSTYSICNENVFKPSSNTYFSSRFPFRSSLFPISESTVWATSFHQLENSSNLEEKA